jgi:hypothetical protein
MDFKIIFWQDAGICLLVIVIVGGVDSVEDPVSPGWATLPVKHIPRPDFVLKNRDSVTTFYGGNGGYVWTAKHIPRPYFALKSKDSVMKFFVR